MCASRSFPDALPQFRFSAFPPFRHRGTRMEAARACRPGRLARPNLFFFFSRRRIFSNSRRCTRWKPPRMDLRHAGLAQPRARLHKAIPCGGIAQEMICDTHSNDSGAEVTCGKKNKAPGSHPGITKFCWRAASLVSVLPCRLKRPRSSAVLFVD